MYDEDSLSDKRALFKITELAKVDNKAMEFLVLLQDAREFGDRDMLFCQIQKYLEDLPRDN